MFDFSDTDAEGDTFEKLMENDSDQKRLEFIGSDTESNTNNDGVEDAMKLREGRVSIEVVESGNRVPMAEVAQGCLE